MGYEPLMDGKPATNVATEHVFKIRATFGASSAVTYRSKDATIAKNATAQWKITLPKPYTEITDFKVGRKAAHGVVPLEFVIVDQTDLSVGGTLLIESIETAVSGAATEPASGDVAYITLGVSCDTLNNLFTG